MLSRLLALERRGWSGQQDLNLRPGVPKTPALPGCAMPRSYRVAASIHASPCASKPRRIRAKSTPHRPRITARSLAACEMLAPVEDRVSYPFGRRKPPGGSRDRETKDAEGG